MRRDVVKTPCKLWRARLCRLALVRAGACVCGGVHRDPAPPPPQRRLARSSTRSMSEASGRRRERDPICDVCGHNHVQGVKCDICGHVGKYIVPGGPNRPNRGAIPPVPPGPLHAPNLTPPTIEGLTVSNFQHALHVFFDLLAQSEAASVAQEQLPQQLANLDQLKVLLDALGDYHAEDEQPSYVLAIPCRPVVVGLASLIPGMPYLASVNWDALAQQQGQLETLLPPTG